MNKRLFLLTTSLLLFLGCSSQENSQGNLIGSSTNEPNNFNAKLNINYSNNKILPAFTIDFAIPSEGFVQLEIRSATGYVIRDFSGNYLSGRHSVLWNFDNDNGEEIKSGIYIIYLKFKNIEDSKTQFVCMTQEECEEVFGA